MYIFQLHFMKIGEPLFSEIWEKSDIACATLNVKLGGTVVVVQWLTFFLAVKVFFINVCLL